MELSVINYKGQDTGRTVTLSDAVFGVEPNTHAVYLDVKQYLANQRQGTHKSKERAEIARTTKKLKRQTGTGGARAGSMKSPLFIGGGRVFGPRPRDYRFKLNQKMKVVARRSVLAAKAKGAQVIVLEDFNFDKPSTKSYINFLSDVKVSNKSLLVLAESTPNVYLSARNLKGVKVVTADTLNTYDIINAQQLLISEKSLERITAILA
jgi:large subunit ribosomal protein L4